MFEGQQRPNSGVPEAFVTPETVVPIDLIAEELLRESVYFVPHSEMRRANRRHKISHQIEVMLKRSLIVKSPELVPYYPDLGEMESYRRFLEGIEDEPDSR